MVWKLDSARIYSSLDSRSVRERANGSHRLHDIVQFLVISYFYDHFYFDSPFYCWVRFYYLVCREERSSQYQ